VLVAPQHVSAHSTCRCFQDCYNTILTLSFFQNRKILHFCWLFWELYESLRRSKLLKHFEELLDGLDGDVNLIECAFGV